MAEQLLDGSDVPVVLEQVVAKEWQRVTGRAAALDGRPVDVESRGRKHPLPGPLAARVRILPCQRPRKLDPAGARSKIASVLPLHEVQMPSQLGRDDARQGRHPILVALAAADDDLVALEVNVLPPEARALEQAQARAVHQNGHEARRAPELS